MRLANAHRVSPKPSTRVPCTKCGQLFEERGETLCAKLGESRGEAGSLQDGHPLVPSEDGHQLIQQRSQMVRSRVSLAADLLKEAIGDAVIA